MKNKSDQTGERAQSNCEKVNTDATYDDYPEYLAGDAAYLSKLHGRAVWRDDVARVSCFAGGGKNANPNERPSSGPKTEFTAAIGG